MVTSKRLGMSLIEAMVICLIVMVGFILMLPALQRARAAARGSQCRSQFQRLGLAMHNYHDAHKMFPPGLVSEYTPSTPGGSDYTVSPLDFNGTGITGRAGRNILSSHSGLTLLLPYLEEKAVFQTYNLDLGCAHRANATAVRSRVQSFLCPTNSMQRPASIAETYYQRLQPKDEVATTDYVLSAGAIANLTHVSPYSLDCCCCVRPHWRSGTGTAAISYRPSAGMFNVNSNVGIRQVKDGTSTTFMMGERAGPMVTGDLMTPWSKGYLADVNGVGGYGSVFAVTCEQCGFDSNYKVVGLNTVVRPNSPNTPQSLQTYLAGTPNAFIPWMQTQRSVSGFYSPHPGGVHFLFGDGHCRRIDNSIDPAVYSGLSTINGRELVNIDR